MSGRAKPRRGVLYRALGCGLALQACSLIVDLDALRDGQPSSDASVPSGGETTPDAHASSSASSGRPPPSSSSSTSGAETDAASAKDSEGALGFCASSNPAHEFCQDFDEAPIDDGWSSLDDSAHVDIELDDLARSAPHSARTLIENDEGCTYARMQMSFGGPYDYGRLSFDLRLSGDESVATTDAYVADIHAGICDYLVHVQPNQTVLYTQINFGQTAIPNTTPVFIAPGDWHNVVLEFRRSDTTVQLSIGGVVVIPFVATDSRCSGPTSVDLSVGLYCQSVAAEARYDNVTFDGH